MMHGGWREYVELVLGESRGWRDTAYLRACITAHTPCGIYVGTNVQYLAQY